jgi:hypothetical protein
MSAQHKPHKRPHRRRETINTIGLQPKTAPDTNGGTVHIQGKVDPDDKAFLAELPEGISYHIRQAVRAYVQQLRSAQ